MTEPYAVTFSRRAAAYYRRLAPSWQDRVDRLIGALTSSPYDPQLSRSLQGSLAGYRRARIGNLRIIFAVDDVLRIVDVTAIGPRGDIYNR